MIDGEISASPAAAARTASRSRCGPLSLRMKPAAPLRRAISTCSSESNVVAITTRSGCCTSGPARRRVAANPSSSGMRMSSRHTSGRIRSSELDRGPPVVDVADHGHVGLAVDDHAEPGADHRLVVGEQHGDRRERSASVVHADVPTAAASRARIRHISAGRPGVERAAQGVDALAHADEAVAGVDGRGVQASGSPPSSSSARGGRAQREASPAPLGSPWRAHVGCCFLGQPLDRRRPARAGTHAARTPSSMVETRCRVRRAEVVDDALDIGDACGLPTSTGRCAAARSVGARTSSVSTPARFDVGEGSGGRVTRVPRRS